MPINNPPEFLESLTLKDLIIAEGSEKWEDLKVPIGSVKTGGVKNPTFEQLLDDGGSSRGVYVFTFSNDALAANEEELFFVAQMPHHWKEESSIIAHVHWVPTTNDSGVVRWGLEYSITNIRGSSVLFPSTTIISDNSPTVNNDLNMHVRTVIGTIDMTGQKMSTMLLCRVFRNSSHVDDTYNADAALLEIDFHHLIDSLGSDQELSKE